MSEPTDDAALDAAPDNAALRAVYAASTPDELADAYRAWSGTYDRETLGSGYCLPFAVAGWIARHVPPGAGPILAALGYPEIHGLDFSPAMLGLAEARGVYGRLVRATLGETLPFSDDVYAAAFATGVFTEGHAPASSLAEIARIVRPGGHAILTVRESVLAAGGFEAEFARLAARGAWRPVERSAPFRAFAIDEPEVTVAAFVFRILPEG